ncbi:hypothetical protein KAI52_04515, partial [Candidatus Parcubacteria bacterium]|nr:hypothetical protein [Candidatus Parcubacteria bacterium]
MVVSQVETNSRNSDLQLSISKINTTLSDNIKFTDKKRERKQKELQEIRETITRKNNEFEKKSLLDSREEIIIETEKFSPIASAKFIAEFQNNNEFKISDNVHYDDDLVISQAKINNYISALKSADSEIWDFVKLNKIPTIDILPSVDILERFFELNKQLNKEELQLFKLYVPDNEDLKKIDNIEENINEYNVYKEKFLEFEKYLKKIEFFTKFNIPKSNLFDTRRQNSIFDIHNSLKKLKEVLLSFNEPHEKELFEILKNDNQKQKWENILTKINKLLKKYNESDSILLGKKVDLINGYKIDYIPALEIISKIIEQAKNNGGKVKKGIGLLFSLNIKKFIKNIKIDGKEIYDNGDIEIINAHFLKIKIEDSLKNIWEQAFQVMANKKEFSVPFNIVEFEGLVSSMARIIYFEENNSELKTTIKSYKLFNKVDIFDLAFVKKSIIVFDNFLSYFKVNEYKNFIDGIAVDFEKDNAHKTTLLLAIYIKEKNIEKIIFTKKEIEKLNERKNLSIEYSKLQGEIFCNTMQKLKTNKHNHKSVIGYFQNLNT